MTFIDASRLRALGPVRLILVGLAIFLLVVLMVAFVQTLLHGGMAQPGRSAYNSDFSGSSGSPGNPGVAWEKPSYDYDNGGGMSEAAYDSVMPQTAPAPSARNVMPSEESGYISGTDAENIERRSYSAYIRSSNLTGTCNEIFSWKPLPYVIFTTQQHNDTSCSAQFKVERMHTDEILSKLSALHPDELNVNTETIKEQIVDYTSRLDILTKQEEVIAVTLEKATLAYDDLVELATNAEDVASLSKVIDSKLSQLERLTRERVTIAAQIEQLARQKAEALDQVKYAHFSVTVDEYQVINWEQVSDSWMSNLQMFAYNVNRTFQELTLGLVTNLLRLAVLAVYVGLLYLMLRVLWRFIQPLLPSRVVLPPAEPTVPSKVRKAAARTKVDGTSGIV